MLPSPEPPIDPTAVSINPPDDSTPPMRSGLTFPVVGVGASAGGLEAFSQLLAAMPGDCGLAFVLVQHLDRTRPSMLTVALSRVTTLPVTEAVHNVRVEPNHVYVIPPNYDMGLLHGALTLVPRAEGRQPHLAIDYFFRALAAESDYLPIGVILSGTGTDGTEGLRAIKAEGGITFAEDPGTAKFSGMPERAIAAGVVDNVVSIPALANELLRLGQHPFLAPTPSPERPLPAEGMALRQIMLLVRAASAIDFSEYKLTTFRRRLARRLALRKCDSLKAYVKILQEEPSEAALLGSDLLIHVTSFFRDPQAFATLKEQILPRIVAAHRDSTPIRYWGAGCSSGEEIYSVAICLLEVLGDAATSTPIQIFGSDISPAAIERARAGLYGPSIAATMSPERLKRFFVPVDGGYRIAKPVRDLCIFVRHDVTRDPPFARMDLVSCRNVMIYFNPALQKKVLALFHYCLNPDGVLFLGSNETAAGLPERFSSIEKVHKFFGKLGPAGSFGEVRLALPPSAVALQTTPATRFEAVPSSADAQRQADHLLLARFAPAGVLVNESLDVFQVRGETGRFLQLAPGRPKMNLMKLLRDGLLADLRAAFQQAREERAAVRREGIEVHQSEGALMVNLEVIPVPGLPESEPFYLVLFDTVTPPVPSASLSVVPPPALAEAEVARAEQRRNARLKEEMAATKDYLQSLLDERQRLNEILASANEELISGNEELQSTNEELETAKEELQSTNEELTTVNDELQNRIQELGVVNGDLLNVLATVDMPVVIVGGDRRIRRFTPRARTLMNLIPGDLGRPIGDIKPNVNVPDFDQQITEVMRTIIMKETEVQDSSGRWYRMQIRPYMTVEHELDGVVISLQDVDELKRAVRRAETSLDYLTGIVETVKVPMVVLDDALAVVSANRAFYLLMRSTASEFLGRPFFDAAPDWNVEGLPDRLGAVLPHGAEFELEARIPFVDGSARTVMVSGRAIRWTTGASLVLLTALDVTERAALLADARQARTLAEQANRAKDHFLAMLSHELRTPLTSILLRVARMDQGEISPDSIRRQLHSIEQAVWVQSHLIDDLLDVSRINSGKLKLDRRPVDLVAVVKAAINTVTATAETRSVTVVPRVEDSVGRILGDATRIQQVVWNLLANAIKFTDAGGQVTVDLQRVDDTAQIRISDTGQGIDPAFLPHVFDRFTQADNSDTRVHGGLGLGLSIVRELVELHDGFVRAESPGPDQGSTFTITLPLIAPGSVSSEDVSAKPVAIEAMRWPAEHPGRAEETREAVHRPELRGIKVLIVDDDASTCEALSELLSVYGAEVEATVTPAAALAVLEKFSPDVILSDIAMPGENGYSFIQKVRAREPGRGGRVPAAAMTAMVASKERDDLLAAGFQMHLPKPVSKATLFAAVRALSAGPPAAQAGTPGADRRS